ncbi:MAG: hypothetical protein ACI8P0_004910 [Planctomycetaceae bacterium]|jgi:hypothetical protein
MTDVACSCCGSPPDQCQCWEFPGWGKVEHITELLDGLPQPGEAARTDQRPNDSKLGQWRATAICGNDITSSCLYVSALAALYAGPLAPVALLLVAGV